MSRVEPQAIQWSAAGKTEAETTSELQRRVRVLGAALGNGHHPLDPFTGDKIVIAKELHLRPKPDRSALLRYRSMEFNLLQDGHEAVSNLRKERTTPVVPLE